jgi:hypothetical protein
VFGSIPNNSPFLSSFKTKSDKIKRGGGGKITGNIKPDHMNFCKCKNLYCGKRLLCIIHKGVHNI